jgi:hypothetical protein
MLRFANKPDEIFLILIDETIEDFLDELEGFNDDPTEQEEIIKASMPRSAALFTTQQLIQQLHALRKASADPKLYQPTDYHWLLLYERLKVYCDLFNDDNTYGCLHERYGIEHIDFDGLVSLFFWDVDFLDDNIANVFREVREALGVSPETFGLTAGLKPHPEELVIKLCNERLAVAFSEDQTEVFVPGSGCYPSFPDFRKMMRLLTEERGSAYQGMVKVDFLKS